MGKKTQILGENSDPSGAETESPHTSASAHQRRWNASRDEASPTPTRRPRQRPASGVSAAVSCRRVRRRFLHVSLAAPRPPAPAHWPGTKMAAPSGGFWTSLLLAAAALKLAAAVSEPTTVPFDVRPGGVVHSFSQDVGPGVRTKPPSGSSTTGDCRCWEEPGKGRVVLETGPNGRGGALSSATCQSLLTCKPASPCPAQSRPGSAG